VALKKVQREREFFIENLLVRIHFMIVMIGWTGLAPWEFEFPFPGSLKSERRVWRTAVERGGNNVNGFKDCRTENGSSQGQNLALTGLFVPSSLDSGC